MMSDSHYSYSPQTGVDNNGETSGPNQDQQQADSDDTVSDRKEQDRPRSRSRFTDSQKQNDHDGLSGAGAAGGEGCGLHSEQGHGHGTNSDSTDDRTRSANYDLEKRDDFIPNAHLSLFASNNEEQYREYSTLMKELMSTPIQNNKMDFQIFGSHQNSINLPGPFAVSLVDRNHDPTLTIVYHCWICETEFFDKLGVVQHLKESHMDVPGIPGIEKKMRVPICLTCGISGGCEHRSINEDSREDEDGDESLAAGKDGKSNGKYPCELCNICLATASDQRDHFSKEHPNQRMYKCSYCPDAFYQHHKLVVHTRTHTGYKPYACGICGSKFPKNSDLNRHIRTHSNKGEKPYQCAQCGQTFTQKCSLEKHARRHADRDGGFPCFHCGMTFAFESELDDHSKKEHGERTWKCKDCGKLFQERRHLIVHAKTHLEGVKYQCSYCDRTFTKRHQLAKHEDRIHHRQDDLRCKVCDKVFRRRENLTRHMNIHLDRREFQCTQCGMAFTEKGSLKRHVLSRHEQHRPFKCRLCGKAFSRRFLLRKHHVRAHKMYPFEGEENPMPTRGFGAKSVNIDSYIRINHDFTGPGGLDGTGSGSTSVGSGEGKGLGGNAASGSGFAGNGEEGMNYDPGQGYGGVGDGDVRQGYEEDAEMVSAGRGFEDAAGSDQEFSESQDEYSE